nr:hypothetical protein [Pedobacter panaciterrae]
MNNTYQYFNRWVYSYYADRNRQSSQGTFAIDLQLFQKEHNFSNFNYPEIKFGNWSKLLTSSHDPVGKSIPLFYGLIALQCHAAMLMEHDGIDSDKMYRSRFVKLTSMESVFFLDACFREPYMGQPIQEVIWAKACNNFMNDGICIFLPPTHNSANRYVQFPKSQVILNREDLKEYKPLLRQLEEESPMISFDDFKMHLTRVMPEYKKQIKRFNNLRKDLSILEKAIRDNQIFNFYCSDWEDTYDREVIKKLRKQQKSCVACVDYNQVELFDNNFESLSSSSFPDVEWLFFKQGDYQNEFWLQNKLEYDRDFLICYPNGRNVLGIGEPLQYCAGKAVFVRVNFSKDNIPASLKLYVIESYPIYIRGVQVNRSNVFISGAGPFLELLREIEYAIHFQGQKLDKFPANISEPGHYVIRISSFPDLSFSVIDSQVPVNMIPSNGTGRNLSNYRLSNSGNRMEGALGFFEEIEEILLSPKKTNGRYLWQKVPNHYNELKKKILRYAWYEED